MALNPSPAPSNETPSATLSAQIASLLKDAESTQAKRRRITEKTMEEVDRRLKHIAYLVADLDLRFVIPKLRELGAMFPNAAEPRKHGVCDLISLDFLPNDEYPAQARICVGMTPSPSADNLRVTVSVVMLPVHLPYEREGWIDLDVRNPDSRRFEKFLDARFVQFVKDYLHVRDPESPYHEDQKVTDPVCQMTFSIVEAACSTTLNDKTYYFCVDGCRRRFEATPERYVEQSRSIKELPGQEHSPLLDAAPGDMPGRSRGEGNRPELRPRPPQPMPQRQSSHRPEGS